MSAVKISAASLAIVFAAISVAQAQLSAHSDRLSREAAHAADVRAIQVQRDRHAANVATLDGNPRAARAFAHAADVRRIQAYRDHRFSGHEHDVARIQRRMGY